MTAIILYMNDVYKNAIEILPMFFDTVGYGFNSTKNADDLAGRQTKHSTFAGEEIFEPLKKIIGFDEAHIFFLNPDSINLRYIYGENNKYNIGNEFKIDEAMKQDLFTPQNMTLGRNLKLIELLDIQTCQSFLIIKLVIKETVFGFVLLGKKEADFYTYDDIQVSKAIGAVISYKVKDVELSDVFKSQVKTLAENVIEIKASDKIKTEFLANISHELRTPLNAIIGFSEILANGFYGELNEKQKEFVRDINVSGIHLMGMINEVLDISKIEADSMKLNKSPFSITLAVDEVVNVLKPLADKKSVKIIKNIKKDVNIFADFQKIQQILYNLLSNAIKFSPERDKIFVEVCLNDNNFVIRVKDSGIGIAPENHQKIFEKFMQLQNAYVKQESSTGLGLTITKELVQMHGGSIRVESELGKGAIFIVELPLI